MIELLKPKYPKYFVVKENLDLEVSVSFNNDVHYSFTNAEFHYFYSISLTSHTQEEMLNKLVEKKLTPIYQYVREEGSSENRIYTVNCTINSLILEVLLFVPCDYLLARPYYVEANKITFYCLPL